jgi:3-hydroxyisobutyrate dehydrogenase-like beta-hydroxyacid dehydrogenase
LTACRTPRAAARQLTTIAGGRRETVEGCAPVFRTFSKTVIHLGATGTGQLGTLFNDALMLMNRKNIADILAIAQAVKLDLPALLEVLRSGSASSAALLALGSAVTASNAKHLQKLELIDVDLFARAVATQRDKAAPVIEQALAGAETLPNLTTLITANTIPN